MILDKVGSRYILCNGMGDLNEGFGNRVRDRVIGVFGVIGETDNEISSTIMYISTIGCPEAERK